MGHFDQLRRSRNFKFSAVLVLIVFSLEEYDLGLSAGTALLIAVSLEEHDIGFISARPNLLIIMLLEGHDLGFSTWPNRATLSHCVA